MTNRFGLLTLMHEIERRRSQRYFMCRCDCGTEKPVRLTHLTGGKIISCGCEALRRVRARVGVMHQANVTHGASDTRAYVIWHAMKGRCLNPNNPAYASYGGRGIAICKRWMKFTNFLADMGQPPDGHEIERINNAKGYKLSNCKWATRREQQNNRRANVLLTHDGKTMTIAEWSRFLSFPDKTIRSRIDAGMSTAEALDPKPRNNSGRFKRKPTEPTEP